jgi:alcohol dehydrogenase
VVVDDTAHPPDAFVQGMELARPRGRVVVAGTRGPRATVPISPDRIVFKELTIVGAVGVDATNYERALAIIASGRYPFEEIDRQVADLGGTSELLGVMSGEHGGARPTHGVVVP